MSPQLPSPFSRSSRYSVFNMCTFPKCFHWKGFAVNDPPQCIALGAPALQTNGSRTRGINSLGIVGSQRVSRDCHILLFPIDRLCGCGRLPRMAPFAFPFFQSRPTCGIDLQGARHSRTLNGTRIHADLCMQGCPASFKPGSSSSPEEYSSPRSAGSPSRAFRRFHLVATSAVSPMLRLNGGLMGHAKLGSYGYKLIAVLKPVSVLSKFERQQPSGATKTSKVSISLRFSHACEDIEHRPTSARCTWSLPYVAAFFVASRTL